jgi:tetratricopeptide (TPR) repeat protein
MPIQDSNRSGMLLGESRRGPFIIFHMRNILRTLPVLLGLALAVTLPVVFSGYSNLRLASEASSQLEAARLYLSAAWRIPWRTDLYEAAGHQYYLAKEYSLANTAYQNAFRRRALSADGWVEWGDANYQLGDPERAAEIWGQGLEQANPSDRLYFFLAQIYKEKRDYAKAAEYLQRYVSIHAQDPTAHYRFGLLLTLTDPETAATELITASQLDPEFDPAAQTLRTALNLASVADAPSARFVIIGRGLALVREWELALAAFEEAVRVDEKNAEAWAWLGETYQQATGKEGPEERRNTAKLYLDRALDLNPISAVVRGLRGLYFQRVGNEREALAEFQSASALEPTNPALYISVGESYARLGDLIRALEAYQYAAALVPNDANYWHLLAQFCAQNNINIDDVGIPAAQRAVVITNEAPEALDMLGWLLLLDARYPEAEQTLLRALEMDPQNAAAHFHLGLLYWQTNDLSSARDHFALARDLGNADAETFMNQYFP